MAIRKKSQKIGCKIRKLCITKWTSPESISRIAPIYTFVAFCP